MEELEAALLRIAVRPATRLQGILDASTRGLLQAVDVIARTDVEVVLVVDQFEEAFTLTTDERERALFLESLRVATAEPDSRVRVIVTFRADFYDRPLVYPRFGELLAARTEAVPPLTPDELEEAIRGPAERIGVRPEPGLVADMIADVFHQPGALPLLQYALTELFDRRKDGTLTLSAYHDIGGVGGALSSAADRIYEATDPAGRKAIKQVFLRLVTLGEGRQDTRRRVTRSELHSLEVEQRAVEAVLEPFGRHRLLTFDREPSTREPTAEIAHEALLGAWGRLREWIDGARDDLRQDLGLARAAAEWRASGTDPSFLLQGTRLEQLEGWAAATDLAIGRTERGYLKASLDHRDRERVAEETRRERERRLERRSRNRLRSLVAVMAVAALVAGSLTVVATNQSTRAQRQALTADAQRIGALALSEPSLDRSFLLAVLGVQLWDLPETRSDLLAVLQKTPALVRVIHPSRTEIRALAVSPDGRLLATGDAKGMIRLYDLRAWERLGATVRLQPVSYQAMAFSPDGQTLAVATVMESRSRLYLVNVSSGTARLLGSWASSSSPAPGTIRLAFSPDGMRIAAALVTAESPLSERLMLIDPLSGRIVWRRRYPLNARQRNHFAPPRNVDVGFTPGGKLVTSASLGDTIVWNATNGRIVGRFSIGGWFDVSPDGRLVALAMNDATGADQRASLALLDLRTGRHRDLDPLPMSNWIFDVGFTADGAHILGRSWQGGVFVWDVRSGSVVQAFSGQGARLTVAVDPHSDTAFSGADDGSVAAWSLSGRHRLEQAFRVHSPNAGCWDTPCFVINRQGSLLAEALFGGKVALVETATALPPCRPGTGHEPTPSRSSTTAARSRPGATTGGLRFGM
jgi:WD40 repeat protein